MENDKEENMKNKGDDFIRIRKDIREGRLMEAKLLLANYIVYSTINPEIDKAELHYLMGNAHRKEGEFADAMNHYRIAIEMDPESPAVEARKTLQGIMNFYNKDMYNH